MGNAPSILLAITKRMALGWDKNAYQGKLDPSEEDYAKLPTFMADAAVYAVIREAFTKESKRLLSDEAVVKICRQLEFWYKDGGLASDPQALKALATSLIDQSLWYYPLITKEENALYEGIPIEQLKVPTRRFGKTELQMPLLTCGGMRFQATWAPDFIPGLRPSRKFVLNSVTQTNIKECIRTCLALGINHFETARMYGTSEYQIVEALHQLMMEGVCKREDFIFQTKIIAGDEKGFRKMWKQSWDNVGEKLGYIDLFGIHAIMNYDDKTKATLDVCEELKEAGLIGHIGFSTHATSEQIMKLINTERFEYVNLHEHFFTSYHGDGTPNSVGGQGNAACVKRALELDMGVFQISPVDKGGKLHRPSKTCCTTIGKELTPIGFALLYGWKKIGFHTASIGLSKPSDLDEVMQAAKLMALEKVGKLDLDSMLDPAIERLEKQKEEVLGNDWKEKGLMNIPSLFSEATDGTHIGHSLRIYDELQSYGMYEWAVDRYASLVSIKWDKKKSWAERVKTISAGNPGRAYDPEVDYSEALKDHYNPSLALQRLKEGHALLKECCENDLSEIELKKRGWEKAYNLTVWTEMPGEIDSRSIKLALLGILTGGRAGLTGTGPGKIFREEARQLRLAL
ncbi:hypothetical protein CTEN210_09508 [Chaetoceros tenuissimus]|uniref:NADP-dependent oxidoreductase domain-containing protein n=1 Tax=Chaetoceros tenuissimus TaxID=426638 RepID=A0AAD3CVY1_9STRA|nr:hypothetical protein CTEN210_09508 [Chaetoceros tenuissimus]